MPYKTPERLDRLIQNALSQDEIINGIKKVRIDDADLIEYVKVNEEKVWTVALEEILNYDNAEKKLIEDGDRSALSSDLPLRIEILLDGIYFILGFTVLSGLALLISFLVYIIKNDGILEAFRAMNDNWFFLVVELVFFILVLASILMRRVYKRQQVKWRRKLYTIVRTNINSRRNTLHPLGEFIDSLLLEKSVKTLMRALINKYLDLSYSILLDDIEAPGLSEVMDLSQVINTKSKARLDFLFNNMSGGSIGISGSRGAGKSTLIQNYCGAERTIAEMKNKKLLPVFTSSPVEYDTRDFILHLFASTCKSFLKQEGAEMPVLNSNVIQETSSGKNKLFTDAFLSGAIGFCFSAGTTLLAVALFIVICSKPVMFHLPIVFRYNLFTIMKMEPGDFFKIGLLLLATSYFIHKITGASYRSIVIYTLKNGLITGFYVRVFERMFKKSRRPAIKENIPVPDKRETLITKAKECLETIKFQQTYTSGWSGALKSPIGLEGGITNSVTVTAKPMTNPEIIHEFTQLLNEISLLDYQIVIGIDELDKMESDVQAQKFLNEIKSIFGIPKCFYLISVSENAMSNFERRGLPFRDVFDSSFDNIVHVDYFDLQESKSLLASRVIGQPVPFFYLSYCLSGGLPRDIIRAFRLIVEIQKKDPENNSLSSINRSIINIEIKGKIRALGFMVKKIESLPETSDFVILLFRLQSELISSDVLMRYITDIASCNNTMLEKKEACMVKDSVTKEMLPAYCAIIALCDELRSYLLLMVTLLDFFNDDLKEDELKKCEENKDLFMLAQARQAMAVNPLITRAIIKDFRSEHNMVAL